MPLKDIQQFIIFGEDQLIKHLEFHDTDIIKALVDVILPQCHVFQCLLSRQYGKHSFFSPRHCSRSDNTYKGTKYAGFLTELNNKLCALNDVNSIYLVTVY